MTNDEYREYHERIAARLRSVAATTTTTPIKIRLLEKADEHDRIARDEEEGAITPDADRVIPSPKGWRI